MDNVVTYIDDVVLCSDSWPSHLEHLWLTFLAYLEGPRLTYQKKTTYQECRIWQWSDNIPW
uniref:Uncharacterized protein n=1 Tax=Anguilla anguilla TaxID=7936 RepID=A0A0E9RGN7_ANGAN